MAKLPASRQIPRIPICFLREIAYNYDLIQASRLLCYVQRHFNGVLKIHNPGHQEKFLQHFRLEHVQVFAKRLADHGYMEMTDWNICIVQDISARYSAEQMAVEGFFDKDTVRSSHLRTGRGWRRFVRAMPVPHEKGVAE